MSDPKLQINTSEDQLHEAVGKALSGYAQVEFAMATVLRNVLKIDFLQAHTLYFAMQNTRSRLEAFQTLLEARFGPNIAKYWESCSAFLLRLATFRNALAHWYASPTIILGKTDAENRLEYKLSHPVPNNFGKVRTADIEHFEIDCHSIRTALTDLAALAKRRRGRPLPKRFRQPITYRNQASLLPPRTPKAPGPRRPPSVPKLSRAQKRAKALKDARRRIVSAALSGPSYMLFLLCQGYNPRSADRKRYELPRPAGGYDRVLKRAAIQY